MSGPYAEKAPMRVHGKYLSVLDFFIVYVLFCIVSNGLVSALCPNNNDNNNNINDRTRQQNSVQQKLLHFVVV